MDLESLTIFSNTAYNCLKEHVQRPTMDQVVRDLEEALEHQWKHDNIEQSAAADKDLSSNRLKLNSSFSLRVSVRTASDTYPNSLTNNVLQEMCTWSPGNQQHCFYHLDIQRVVIDTEKLEGAYNVTLSETNAGRREVEEEMLQVQSVDVKEVLRFQQQNNYGILDGGIRYGVQNSS
ncbi:protein kinase-like domain-containing protein [Artemisia annua]|uniref:Protein kinase-like domain-containing protein n=1 Tax=Artemisia annua TaxID=35608 RepID=A0A2U1PUF2_ARTAN|nr:protein kinase-like domain-containing protein [Artemisia annua]